MDYGSPVRPGDLSGDRCESAIINLKMNVGCRPQTNDDAILNLVKDSPSKRLRVAAFVINADKVIFSMTSVYNGKGKALQFNAVPLAFLCRECRIRNFPQRSGWEPRVKIPSFYSTQPTGRSSCLISRRGDAEIAIPDFKSLEGRRNVPRCEYLILYLADAQR